jgi:plastocyanin
MRRSRLAGPALLGILLVAIALVAAAAAPQDATAKTRRVAITDYRFTPQVITVKKGTKVVWKNADGAAHNVVSANGMGTSADVTGRFASPTLNQGQSWSYTFKKKGTFFYLCTFHAGMASMHGKVVVK